LKSTQSGSAGFCFRVGASDRSRYQASQVRGRFYAEDKSSHHDVIDGRLPARVWLKEIGRSKPVRCAGQNQKPIPASGLGDHGVAWSRDMDFANVVGIDCLHLSLFILGHRRLPFEISCDEWEFNRPPAFP
jgi:hypothetical protein